MATGDNDRAGGRLTFSLDAPLPPDCARGAHAQTCEARGPCGEGLQRLLHSFRRLVNQERPFSKPWGDKDHEDEGDMCEPQSGQSNYKPLAKSRAQSDRGHIRRLYRCSSFETPLPTVVQNESRVHGVAGMIFPKHIAYNKKKPK